MELISVYETFLYYCCLVLVAKCVMDCKPKMLLLGFSFLAFIPLFMLAVYSSISIYNIAYIVFLFAQFLLIKFTFNVKPWPFVFLYVMMYCANMVAIALLIMLLPSHKLAVDVAVNTLSFSVCSFACLSKVRYKVQQLFVCTPKYVLFFSALLLIASAGLSVLVFGNSFATHLDVWSTSAQIAIFCLLLIIGIITPILIANAISNSQLRSLTANYEQQIEAQAKHYKELAAANYKTRRFKHDFNNMRIAIEKTLADGKNEQALALIQQCGNALENPTGAPAAFNTGNGIADALLTDKQQRASHCNAIIQFDGTLPQNCLSPTDLCVILGNTLDNAIEACQKLSPNTKKVISVACHCNSGFAFLSICNPVAEKVNIDHNYVATTKENKTLHGFGLYSLQSVVKKYEGNLEFLATDDAFSVEIDLCLIPDKTAAHSPHIRH